MLEVTQADRDQRREILKLIIEAIDRPCSEGDGIDDRQDKLDELIAAHRIAAIEECAKVAESDLFAHEECDVAESIAGAIRALKGGNDV